MSMLLSVRGALSCCKPCPHRVSQCLSRALYSPVCCSIWGGGYIQFHGCLLFGDFWKECKGCSRGSLVDNHHQILVGLIFRFIHLGNENWKYVWGNVSWILSHQVPVAAMGTAVFSMRKSLYDLVIFAGGDQPNLLVKLTHLCGRVIGFRCCTLWSMGLENLVQCCYPKAVMQWGEEFLLQLIDWFGVCHSSLAEQLPDSGPCCCHSELTLHRPCERAAGQRAAPTPLQMQLSSLFWKWEMNSFEGSASWQQSIIEDIFMYKTTDYGKTIQCKFYI